MLADVDDCKRFQPPRPPVQKADVCFWPCFDLQEADKLQSLGCFQIASSKKKKRPKSTNVSKFQVAAAAHEACRSSQKDFLCLLFFNHRALARLIACCSSIGPLFQLLLGDVLEEANASPKL